MHQIEWSTLYRHETRYLEQCAPLNTMRIQNPHAGSISSRLFRLICVLHKLPVISQCEVYERKLLAKFEVKDKKDLLSMS